MKSLFLSTILTAGSWLIASQGFAGSPMGNQGQGQQGQAQQGKIVKGPQGQQGQGVQGKTQETPVCYANSGLGFGDHWVQDGREYAKDSQDLNDNSICLVGGGLVQGKALTSRCGSNHGLGFGDHWIQDGQEFAKDDPDLSDSSICAVVR